MARLASSSLTLLIHHLLRHPNPFCLLLRPFSISVLTRNCNHHDEPRYPFSSPSISSSLPLPNSFSSTSIEDVDSVSLASPSAMVSKRESERSEESPALKLSVKEKKKLASYAHSLGHKLKCQLLGKSGLTDSVVFSFLETLEKNQLLKVKIHKTCPGELEDMILHLEEATGSVAVGNIARTVILYRPSPTKLTTEAKKTKETQSGQ